MTTSPDTRALAAAAVRALLMGRVDRPARGRRLRCEQAADMKASGMKRREIAAAMDVTPSTVGHHLLYAKQRAARTARKA